MRSIAAIVIMCVVVGGCASSGSTQRHRREIEKEIEALAPPAPTDTNTAWYTMGKGDTIYAIARRFNTTVEEISRLNPTLGNVNALPIGTVLRVPATPDGGQPPNVPPPAIAPAPPKPPPDLTVSGQGYVWPVRGKVMVKFAESLPGDPPSRSRGIDVAVQPGDDVRATRAGVAYVVRSSMPEFGDAVAIDHGDGVTSFYGYGLVIEVDNEQRVQQGQVIALAPRISPARVHFRVQRNGEPVDPMPLLPSAQ